MIYCHVVPLGKPRPSLHRTLGREYAFLPGFAGAGRLQIRRRDSFTGGGLVPVFSRELGRLAKTVRNLVFLFCIGIHLLYEYINTHTRAYTLTHIYTHKHIHTYTHTHIYTYTYIHIHTYIYIYIYIVHFVFNDSNLDSVF